MFNVPTLDPSHHDRIKVPTLAALLGRAAGAQQDARKALDRAAKSPLPSLDLDKTQRQRVAYDVADKIGGTAAELLRTMTEKEALFQLTGILTSTYVGGNLPRHYDTEIAGYLQFLWFSL